jgi:hypothetical protein
MGTAVEGFHSSDWWCHLPSLLQLVTLMRTWSGDKPLPILHNQLLAKYSECDTGILEDAVAHFYNDTFFIFFGHAGLPYTHSHMGIKVKLIMILYFNLLIVPQGIGLLFC